MNNPHTESQSQDYVSIKSSESKIDWSGLYKIKLIMRQPSPNWKNFGIDETKIVAHEEKTHYIHETNFDSTIKTSRN